MKLNTRTNRRGLRTILNLFKTITILLILTAISIAILYIGTRPQSCYSNQDSTYTCTNQ